MKQITIWNILSEVRKTVQRHGKRKGLCPNKECISPHERGISGKVPEEKKKALHHDLDHFAGLWSQKETAEFGNNLKAQRKMDLELWKKQHDA
jgi:hypothetical protein